MPQYEYGAKVRVIRNVRDDGTFYGAAIGNLLVRRGSVGYVRDVGTFLQDQIIYSVHFLDEQKTVGCREEELIGGDDPWEPSLYEFRDKVTTKVTLAIEGEVIANPGDVGEILKVISGLSNGFAYHVRFPGRTLQVPEKLLEEAPIPGPSPARGEGGEEEDGSASCSLTPCGGGLGRVEDFSPCEDDPDA